MEDEAERLQESEEQGIYYKIAYSIYDRDASMTSTKLPK